MTKLIVGCGYLGKRVARAWRGEGDHVVAMTRSHARAALLASEGLRPLVADLLQPETLVDLPKAATILFAVARDPDSTIPAHSLYVDGLQNLIGALPSPPDRFIMISTTGVYGDVAGVKVDETTVCQPRREGGIACLAAEEALRDGPLGARSIILRLGGIYGPGRIPRLAEIRGGHPIAAPRNGRLNLIHVDDAVRVVQAAEQVPPPRLYVVTDNQPPTRGDYLAEIARLLGAPPPSYAPVANSPATQRAGSDKHAASDKLFAELNVSLAYPSYREGLAAILSGAAEDGRADR